MTDTADGLPLDPRYVQAIALDQLNPERMVPPQRRDLDDVDRMWISVACQLAEVR